MDITPLVKDNYVTVDENATISELIGMLKSMEKRYALVFRNKKYLGMLEKKSLLRSRLDTGKTKVAGHVLRTPILPVENDILECAYFMFKSGLDALPVEKDKQIIGVLEGMEVAAAASEHLKKLKVKDVKLVKPAVLRKDDTVAAVLEIMHDQHVDHVPLFDKKDLYGIISYRDLLRSYLNWTPKRDFSARFNKQASTKGAEPNMPDLAALPAGNFATRENLALVQPESSLREAISLMRSRNLPDLLVMKDAAFAGLLTVKNILRLVGSFKVPITFAIKFVGLNETHLEPDQKLAVEKIAGSETAKLQRQLRNEVFSITLHIKEYSGDGGKHKAGKHKAYGGGSGSASGKKHKYSIHCRLEYPGQIMTVSQDDWDIETALHKTFENARNAVKKKFRGDVSWKRSYG